LRFFGVISLQVISHTEFMTTNCSSVQHVVKIAATSHLNSAHKANNYEGWNFNSGNYLFTTDTK